MVSRRRHELEEARQHDGVLEAAIGAVVPAPDCDLNAAAHGVLDAERDFLDLRRRPSRVARGAKREFHTGRRTPCAPNSTSVSNKAKSSIRERNPSAGLFERRTARTRGIISTSRAR